MDKEIELHNIHEESPEEKLWEQYELERNEYQLGFATPGEYFPCFEDWKKNGNRY